MTRLVGWTLTVAALIGLGVALYASSLGPRWRVVLPRPGSSAMEERFLDADRFLIPTVTTRDGVTGLGPMRCVDTRTGQLLYNGWDRDEVVWPTAYSAGGHWAAAIERTGMGLRLLDLRTGRDRHIPLTAGRPRDISFSPDARFVVAWEGEGGHLIAESRTGAGSRLPVPPGASRGSPRPA